MSPQSIIVSYNDTKRTVDPAPRSTHIWLHRYALVAYLAIHADSDLAMRTKGTLLMKMVGGFVSSKLHRQLQ